jgi:hypothetical protein
MPDLDIHQTFTHARLFQMLSRIDRLSDALVSPDMRSLKMEEYSNQHRKLTLIATQIRHYVFFIFALVLLVHVL